MTVIAPFAFWQLLDNNGDPLSGGKLFAYEAGTSTPKDTFTDESGDTANTNPVILDSSGRADVWLEAGEYKFSLFDSADNLIKTVDNISGVTTGDAVAYSVSTNTNIVESYNQGRVFATGTISLSLLAAATAGDGFEIYVKNNGSGFVTINPDASETINGVLTLVLVPNAWAIVYCDGSAWQTFGSANVLNNLNATTAPTSSNDSTQGYSAGSIWIDTTADESYRCLDASAGTAVWETSTLTIDDLGNAVTYDVASQAEAEAGASSTTLMTPQRTAQAIDERGTWAFVEATSISSDADWEPTAAFENGYDYESIFDDLMPATDAVNLFLTAQISGGSYLTGSTDYFFSIRAGVSGSGGVVVASTASSMQINVTSADIGNGGNEGISGTLFLKNPMQGGKQLRVRGDYEAISSGATFHGGSCSYQVLNNTNSGADAAISRVKLAFSSGNISSGDVRIYRRETT